MEGRKFLWNSNYKEGNPVLRMTTALFALVLSTACATHPKTVATRPVIKRIAVIPASNPRWYTFENAAPPVGGYPLQFWVNKLDSKSKARLFNDKVSPQSAALGSDLTEQVAASLRDRGFIVEILEGVTRPPDDPDNVDDDKVSTGADAILHLRISEVGLYSSGYSRNYIPRVNASGKLFVRGEDDNVYDEDLCYGVDAKKGKEWAIQPDAKYTYPSFDAVMAHIEEVRSSFADGTREISTRMSGQIVDSIKGYHSDALVQAK
jgi:hypothetical protein